MAVAAALLLLSLALPLCTLHAPMVPHVAAAGAKIVHLVAAPPADDPATPDARLSKAGLAQCAGLAALTARLDSIELVVCSPLTRSLQTVTAGFADYVARGSPVVALEAVRELVQTKADSRRPTSELASEFGHVCFSELSDETDVLWDRLGGAAEGAHSAEALEARCAAAVRWLLARPEKEVVVVSHPALLHHLANVGYEPLTQPPIEEGLDPRLRPPPAPPPPFASDSRRLRARGPLVAYPSQHMARTLRPAFSPCELRIVAAVPL
jgi:broad specificity phosphatase PhoE